MQNGKIYLQVCSRLDSVKDIIKKMVFVEELVEIDDSSQLLKQFSSSFTGVASQDQMDQEHAKAIQKLGL